MNIMTVIVVCIIGIVMYKLGEKRGHQRALNDYTPINTTTQLKYYTDKYK